MKMYHVIRCIEFCDRQEAHQGSDSFDLVEPDYNKGVFKAALRLERTDQKRSDLFLQAPRNASYLS